MSKIHPSVSLNHPFDIEGFERISLYVKNFENKVWFPYLKRQVNSTDIPGMRGEIRSPEGELKFTVMTYVFAGRCPITLTRPDGHWVTLCVAPDSDDPSMGLHLSSKEWPDAQDMIWEATLNWHRDQQLTPDLEVTFI
jgi:hypothetical protein